MAKVQSTLHITFARGKVLGWQTNNTNIFYQILVIGVSLLHIICIILFIVLRRLEVILGLWSPQNSLDFFRFLILILLFRKIGTGILTHIGRSSLRPLGSCCHLSCFWAWRSFGEKIVFGCCPLNYLLLVKMLLATLHSLIFKINVWTNDYPISGQMKWKTLTGTMGGVSRRKNCEVTK